MIVDTSAVVAIVTNEPERRHLLEELLRGGPHQMSAATLLETSIVIDRLVDPVLSRLLDDLLGSLAIAVVPFSASHAAFGRAAYRDFGKGSGHPAQLNLGDCFAYALARETGQDLLFKGDDFGHTDLRAPAE